MSLERIIKALQGFGLKRIEAEVYVYLAKKGPQKGRDLADALNIRKQQLYHILKKLQSSGIVTSNLGQPSVFSAKALEEVLNLYIKLNLEQAEAIKENKQELLTSWKSIDE